jgi:hypothetical protein
MTASVQKFEGTPERYLSVPKGGGGDIDAISCAILRAQALVALLHCQFDEEDGTRLSNEMITNALWGIEGHLDQLQAMCAGIEKGSV